VILNPSEKKLNSNKEYQKDSAEDLRLFAAAGTGVLCLVVGTFVFYWKAKRRSSILREDEFGIDL
jgi:hypothetical protein